MRKLGKYTTIGLASVFLGLGMVSAKAAYPEKPIQVIIGFSAGGGTDVMLRLMAEGMSKRLNVPVVVENRPGANGNIANQAVVAAACDGYTLGYNTSSMILSPYLYKKLTYDFAKDLKPVSLAVNTPLILIARPDFPASTIQEFEEYLKANPGKFNYGSAGVGNVTHLSAIQMLSKLNTTGTHVPYRGEAAVYPDLMGSHVDFYLSTAPGALPLIKGNRVKALGVTSKDRIKEVESLPTFSETIMPETEMGAWSGFVAPACTSDEVVNKLSEVIIDVLNDSDIREKLYGLGAEPRGTTPKQYADFIQSEFNRWGEAVKAGGIKPE